MRLFTPQVPDVLLSALPGSRRARAPFSGRGSAGITIRVRAKCLAVPYPDCGELSHRVHSRYRHTLADLPWHDTAVQLRLQTRRFFCSTASCRRRIIAERLPGTAACYGRRTVRLATALQAIAFASGGRAGARLLHQLRMEGNADTLLHPLRAPGSPLSICSPRVLGVDDWAYRRGRTYGTLLVDLEEHKVIEFLPDRSAETLAAWLQQYPGIEVIARDRSTEYARGIPQGAPNAQQVADRWHLLHNLRQVLDRFFTASHARLKAAARQTGVRVPPLRSIPQRRSRGERAASEAARERRLARFEEVRRLHRDEGLKIHPSARRLRMSPTTVRKYLSAEAFPEWTSPPPKAASLSPYEDYLKTRWRDGFRNARQLWLEIHAQGYTGSLWQTYRWAQPRQTEPAKNTPRKYHRTCLAQGLDEPKECASRHRSGGW